MTIEGFHFLISSSVGYRDGMSFELVRDDDGERAAEVFRNDDTGERTFTAFQEAIPLEAIELLLKRAREEL